MYGLDSFILPPPLSIFLSLALILGIDSLGLVVLGRLSPSGTCRFLMRWQAPLVGAVLLGTLVYSLALMGVAQIVVMRTIAIVVMCAGMLSAAGGLRKSQPARALQGLKIFYGGSPMRALLMFLLASYALLCLSPITNADSLDYHVGVALHILNTGAMPATPEWFAGRLAGSGEALNALGFSVGAEQFGALLQLVALLSICGVLLNTGMDHTGANQDRWRTFLAVSALSAPVLVFLVASVKPQLLPAAMTTLALYFTVSLDKYAGKNRVLLAFSGICLLVMAASQMKFSFLLGGGIVGLAAMIIMVRKGYALPALIIGLLMAAMLMLPAVVWKTAHFDAGPVEAFLTPMPGNWPGTDAFEDMLRNYSEGSVPFPFSLVLPSGFGTLTTVIGLGLALFIFIRPGRGVSLKVISTLMVVEIVFLLVLSSPVSRSYLEPYFWGLLALSIQGSPNMFTGKALRFQVPVCCQAFGVLLMCWFGIISALPGMLTREGRVSVMDRYANGYSLVAWIDGALPRNAVLLTTHRSMGLMPRRSVSMDWFNYASEDASMALPYLSRIREEKASFMLVMADDIDQSEYTRYFSGCLESTPIGPHQGFLATRNPFNTGGTYNAWLIRVRSDLLPGCAAGDQVDK